MTAPIDHLGYNRAFVSAALRRLADAALIASEQYADAPGIGAETEVLNSVYGRVDGLKHAVAIVHATRTGIGKAASERRDVA